MVTFDSGLYLHTIHLACNKYPATFSIALHYAGSLCFGVTYNRYHLLYTGLLSCTLFGLFSVFRKIQLDELNYVPKKGIKIFLILVGIALIVALIPDVIQTIITNATPPFIEVYTTSVTNVLDELCRN